MDSDIVSRLNTPDGPLVLLPYPVVTVDMGQNLARMKSPPEIAALWLDYVLELAEEARADASREATTAVIGIHPFVVGLLISLQKRLELLFQPLLILFIRFWTRCRCHTFERHRQ